MTLERRREDGYVLAVTLWVMVAILISATLFASRVGRTLEAATTYRELVDTEVEMASARADLLMRIATTPFSDVGLIAVAQREPLRFDDRRYASGPSTMYSVQDLRGVVNLNNVGTDAVVRLLAPYGIGRAEAERLADTLADYVDDDSLRRLNGAEVSDYLAAGLPPPRNAPLLGVGELARVYGWREHPELLSDPRFLASVSTTDVSGLNPNTATVPALLTLPNMSIDAANAIVASRELQPFPSASLFAQVIGVDATFAMTRISTFPSTHLRITQYARGRPWALRYNLALLPNGETDPWQLQSAARIAYETAPSDTESPAGANAPGPTP